VVVLEPRHSHALPEPAGVPYMDQEARTFIPSVMFVRTGYPAEFRNSDEEMHNVNVKDLEKRTQLFNVAIPVGGKYTHHFDARGIFDVSCDVHPGMSAEIVATTGPYVTFTSAGGHFEFAGVVPGPYTLFVYAGAQRIEQPIEVSAPATVIDVSGSR
jgi:hypothetical protein